MEIKPTYPTKYCPPELFEPNKISEKLESLIFKNNILDISTYIVNVIGEPRRENLSDWCDNYRNLWTPIIAQLAREKGVGEVVSLEDTLRTRIAKNLLGTMNLQEKDFNYLMSRIDNPWVLIFIYWHLEGRKEYVVSSGLVQRLKQTRLKGYPTESFKLPYDCFYVDLQNYGTFGKTQPEGCMITYLENSFGIALITTGAENKFPRMFEVGLRSSTLDQALDSAIQEYKRYEAKFENTKSLIKPWKALFSYIINVVLYATMPDAEANFEYYDSEYKKLKKRLAKTPKKSKKRKKIAEQLKKRSDQGCLYLGGSIFVDRAQETQRSEGSKTGRTLSVRTLVSGHWRDQVCGKDRLDRKRIWIQPFWRGPEQAPITQKTHELR